MKNKRPIILIPGIQGTTLNNVNDNDFVKIFSGFRKYYKNIHNLKLKKDGISDEKEEMIIERSDVEDLAYFEIINYLRELGFNVYIFGYDWRISNIENGKRLDAFVKKLAKKLDVKKFNFLTHSMGGLVFSTYLKSKTEQQLETILDKVIICNPPFLGSLEATLNLVIGKSKLFNQRDDFRKVSRTFPAIYELCPVYENSYSYTDDRTKIDYFDYFKNFQHKKDGLEEENTKNKIMIHRFEALKKVRTEPKKLIFDFSQLPKSIRDNMLILVGSGVNTRRTLPVVPLKQDIKDNKSIFNYFDFSQVNEDKIGDGTVHHLSSTVFKDSIQTIDVESRYFETLLDASVIGGNDWHSFFLNNGRVQNIIKRYFQYNKTQLNEVYAVWWASIGGGAREVKEDIT